MGFIIRWIFPSVRLLQIWLCIKIPFVFFLLYDCFFYLWTLFTITKAYQFLLKFKSVAVSYTSRCWKNHCVVINLLLQESDGNGSSLQLYEKLSFSYPSLLQPLIHERDTVSAILQCIFRYFSYLCEREKETNMISLDFHGLVPYLFL